MCATNPGRTWQLTSDTQAPQAARDLLTSAWCTAHHRVLLDDVLLLVTEVATNAVLHGGPPITLHADAKGPRVCSCQSTTVMKPDRGWRRAR